MKHTPTTSGAGPPRRHRVVAALVLVAAGTLVGVDTVAGADDSELNHPDYWAAIYGGTCVKTEAGQSSASGTIGTDALGEYVSLTSPPEGSDYTVLIVKAGAESSVDNPHAVYEDPLPGTRYRAPDNKDISHWIVCVGQLPPTTTTDTSTTDTSTTLAPTTTQTPTTGAPTTTANPQTTETPTTTPTSEAPTTVGPTTTIAGLDATSPTAPTTTPDVKAAEADRTLADTGTNNSPELVASLTLIAAGAAILIHERRRTTP